MESIIRNTTPNFSPFGLVRHQIVSDVNNDPFDCRFIEVNSTFEKWFEYDKCDIIGKSLSQIQPLPALPRFNWMSFICKILQNNGMGSLEIYSHQLQKLLTIQAYYESDQFTTLFIDSTPQLIDREKINRFKRTQSQIARMVDEFSGLSGGDVFDKITKNLNELVQYFDAGRGYVFEFNDERNISECIYKWIEPTESSDMEGICDIVLNSRNSLSETKKLEKILFIEEISQFSGSGILAKSIESMGIKSLLLFPLFHNNNYYGFIGFDSSNKNLKYTNDQESLLKVFSSILFDLRNTKEKYFIEHKLLESEKRFRDIIDSLPVISVQGYDKNRNVIYWNKASETLYGYTSEEALDKKLEDLIIPDNMKEGVVQGIQDWLDKGIKIPSSELTLRKKDNSPVNIYSNHLMVKNIYGDDELFCIDCDLTELKKVEHDLKESELYHRTLLKTIPDIVFVISVNGVLIDIHQTIEFDHFLSGKELINKNIRDVLPLEIAEKQLKALNKCILNQTIEDFEFHLNTPDGINYYSARTVSFGPDKGLVTVRNITEYHNNLDSIKSLLLTEEKLNESLRNFTYIVSHNLRIHTANMLGVFMLMEETDPDLYNNPFMQILNTASKNLEVTVNDLNNVLKIKFKEKSSREKINLSELIDEIVAELNSDSSEQDVTIITHIPTNTCIHAVVTYLRSILFHLISNGIKYKSADQEPWVRIYLEESEDYLKICVEDNGIGIDMDHNKSKLSQMYKRFNNSKNSKGFGLFISKIQAEAMGGFIQIDSKLNQGSILSVFIPYEKD